MANTRIPKKPQTSDPVTARPPTEKPTERLSPGMYRGDKGGLVGAGGKTILRQPDHSKASNFDFMHRSPPITPNRDPNTYRPPNTFVGTTDRSFEEIMSILDSYMRRRPGSQDVKSRNAVISWFSNAAKNPQLVADVTGRFVKPNQGSSMLPDLGQAKPIRREDYPRYGKDPRDPNSYSVLPDGGVVGTLIGWTPGGMPDLNDPDGKPGTFQPPPQQPGNAIPRANRNGLIRLSPGVYQDSKGNIVKSAKG